MHIDSTLGIAAENIDTTFIRSIYKPKGFTYANSNYNRSILSQNSASKVGKVIQLVKVDDKYSFFFKPINSCLVKSLNCKSNSTKPLHNSTLSSELAWFIDAID